MDSWPEVGKDGTAERRLQTGKKRIEDKKGCRKAERRQFQPIEPDMDNTIVGNEADNRL